MTELPLTAIEPERWVLVFQRTTKLWWVRWLSCGRYKHVAAYAYLPGFKAWLIYDVSMIRTAIVVVPDGDEALGYLYELTRDADLMAFKRMSAPLGPPVFGWCVPSIKRLIGLRSGALRGQTLWKHCLAAGGEPLEQQHAPIRRAAA